MMSRATQIADFVPTNRCADGLSAAHRLSRYVFSLGVCMACLARVDGDEGSCGIKWPDNESRCAVAP
jgi:hypothetical protein